MVGPCGTLAQRGLGGEPHWVQGDINEWGCWILEIGGDLVYKKQHI